MKIEQASRISGLLLIIVFLVNVYLGLADTNLQSTPTHLEANWTIAVLTLIAAIILFVKPKSMFAVAVAGIIWPILYVGSLAFDVYTKLCFDSTFCWPTRTDAFQYLILNNPNIPGGLGWKLFQGIIPLAIALLFIVFLLSIYSVVKIRRTKRMQFGPPPPPAMGPPPSAPPP